MMNPKSEMKDNILHFKNFMVKKCSEHMWGVYQKWSGNSDAYYSDIITSGETFVKAAKKAKLLQIGYDLAKDSDDDWW